MSLFHVCAVNVHTALHRIMPTEMSACVQKNILICPQSVLSEIAKRKNKTGFTHGWCITDSF